MNRNNLYSRIQANIGDFTWNKVQKEEYYLIFQEVMSELSMSCLFNTVLYSEKVLSNTIDYTISLPDTQIYKLEYVKRDNTDCREISLQSVVTAQTNLNRGFHVNDTELSDIHYCATVVDDNMVLKFVNELQAGTVIESLLITNTSVINDTFEDTSKLPYFAYNAIYYGMYVKVLDKLITLGNSQMSGIYGSMAINYQNEKIKLKAYIRNLKTNSSFPQIQPLLWLSED